MIKHIVFFKSTENNIELKNAIIENISSSLKSLKAKIPEIISLEVGINFSDRDIAFDFSLETIFASIEDLNLYQNHADHLKVVNQIKDNNLQSAVVDYEYNN